MSKVGYLRIIDVMIKSEPRIINPDDQLSDDSEAVKHSIPHFMLPKGEQGRSRDQQNPKSNPKHTQGRSPDTSVVKQSAKNSPKRVLGGSSQNAKISPKQSAMNSTKRVPGRSPYASTITTQNAKISTKSRLGRSPDASLINQSAKSNPNRGLIGPSLDASAANQSAKSSPRRALRRSLDASVLKQSSKNMVNRITPAADTLQKDLKIFRIESSDERMLEENGIDIKFLCRKATEELSKRSKNGEITDSTTTDIEGTYKKLLMELSTSTGDIRSVIDLGLGLADEQGASLLKTLGKSTDEIELAAQKAKKWAILLQLSLILYDEATPLLMETMSMFQSTNLDQ